MNEKIPWNKNLPVRPLLALLVFVLVVFAVNAMTDKPVAAIVSGLVAIVIVLALFWALAPRRRKWTLFGFAILITLLALAHTFENWRGTRAWEKFQREQETKGEILDLQKLIPPPVLDEQNFAMHPLWVEQIAATMGLDNARKWYPEQIQALDHTNFSHVLKFNTEIEDLALTNRIRWSLGKETDLKGWQDYYRRAAEVTNYFPVPAQPQTPAEDVLLALSGYDEVLEQIREASHRSHARFPINYAESNPAAVLLPHLAILKRMTSVLTLRASADLAAGRNIEALEDIELMVRLSDAVAAEPILITHLVRLAIFSSTLQPVWEGLANRLWSETDLMKLQRMFASLDILEDHASAMRGERAFGVAILDFIKREPDAFRTLFSPENGDEKANFAQQSFARLIPKGWISRNQISIVQMHNKHTLPVIDPAARRAYPEKASDLRVAALRESFRPYDWISQFLLPAIGNVAIKSARAQASLDQTRIAIALEQFRLANGELPETLAALVPTYLPSVPNDLVNGEPLKYRRQSDGYILYSVGWNLTDDTGMVVETKAGNADDKQGDWVWFGHKQN